MSLAEPSRVSGDYVPGAHITETRVVRLPYLRAHVFRSDPIWPPLAIPSVGQCSNGHRERRSGNGSHRVVNPATETFP